MGVSMTRMEGGRGDELTPMTAQYGPWFSLKRCLEGEASQDEVAGIEVEESTPDGGGRGLGIQRIGNGC